MDHSPGDRVYDLLGVGFGPSNIALAVALDELWPTATVKFLEAQPQPGWQSNLLLRGSDVQHHPLRDLVTPRNPRSRFTFVNFLHENGRLFHHLNLGLKFPLRAEYADYVRWVAGAFADVTLYAHRVVEIETTPSGQFVVQTQHGGTHVARALVLGPGRTPYVPAPFEALLGDTVFHASHYLAAVADLDPIAPHEILVVGGSQTAVELLLDLAARYPNGIVTSLHTGFGFRLKDTSPFREEVYFPEFVDYFHAASRASKAQLTEELRFTNYSAADEDVIKALYLRIYEDRIRGEEHIRLLHNRFASRVARAAGGISVTTTERHSGEIGQSHFDRVILATGFRNQGTSIRNELFHPLLGGLVDRLALDEGGCPVVGRDYRLVARDAGHPLPPIYLNGLCEATHGFGDSGSFSMVSLRAETIVRSLRAGHPTEAPKALEVAAP
jgi:L-ornithine N5-monooxygenase